MCMKEDVNRTIQAQQECASENSGFTLRNLKILDGPGEQNGPPI